MDARIFLDAVRAQQVDGVPHEAAAGYG